MISLLRADWRKLRHRWMPRILILILLVLVALIFFAVSRRARFQGDLSLPDGFIVALSLAGGFAPFIWPVLAGSWGGGEYGWGTMRVTLTRMPSRIAFSVSGLLMVLFTLIGTLVLVLGVGAIAGSIVGGTSSGTVLPGPAGANATEVIIKMFLAVALTSSFYAVLAYTAGVVFRSVPAGVGIGIGFSVAQSVVLAIFTGLGDPWKAIAQHFPDAYAEGLTTRVANELVIGGPFSRISSTAAGIPQAIIGLAIYIGVLLAVMLSFVRYRDISV
jgi:hypothetical protein